MSELWTHAPWWYALAALGALCIGMAKSGFTGISLISVFVFADLFGAKTSTGLLLPLLIAADLMVYPAFRAHGSWRPVWPLLVPALLGLAMGFWLLGKLDDGTARHGIGVSILLMVMVQAGRWWVPQAFQKMADSRGFGWAAGVLGGLATMMANAAGPVIQLFLLSRRIPKMELIGVSARFFLLINLIKVPLSLQLSLIRPSGLWLNALLLPAVWLGIRGGKYCMQRVPQRVYEALIVGFALIAGLRLCFF